MDTKLISWFGMNRTEYYATHYQPGDPHWEELGPDEDGDGCQYGDYKISGEFRDTAK